MPHSNRRNRRSRLMAVSWCFLFALNAFGCLHSSNRPHGAIHSCFRLAPGEPNTLRTLCCCSEVVGQQLGFRNVSVTPTPSIFPKVLPYKWGRTAVQMGGVLQYKWEAYCGVSLSSKLRSQESTAIQMGGVLPYKLEVYCRTFQTSCRGWGFRNIALGWLGNYVENGVPAPPLLRQEKRAQRLTFGSGDRQVRWGSSTGRGGGRKLRALPRNFVFPGFRGEESGMSREFCRDVPDPCGCSKSLCKKSLCAFFVPYLPNPPFSQTRTTLEKNKHFGADIPRGRPRENFGLKTSG